MKSKRILALVLVTLLIVSSTIVTAFSVSAETLTPMQQAQAYDQQAYTGNDLGCTYTPTATTFKVWSPSASAVQVKLYKTGSDSEAGAGVISTTDMTYTQANGLWSVTINGDLKNDYYTYLVTNNGTTNEVVDIYAKAVGINGNRGMVCDLSSTDPNSWSTDKHVLSNNPNDAIIWECDVKDFSYNSNSGIPAAHRGKYLAFTDLGTTLNGAGKVATGIDYLKQLGITAVHLNPFYDFKSIDEVKNTTNDSTFNWGYDPKNYNAPEGTYSSDPYNGNTRINEVKQMVQALHNAGISVIMDVVYNHTGDSKTSWFNETVPNYYYRVSSTGAFEAASGCGNDTASEHLMFRKYMEDSVMYWASEYHIDGFRFDLMGLHDVTTMNDIRADLDNLYADGSGKKILMYGEGWSETTPSAYTGTVLASQKNASQLSDRISFFNDTVRDAIHGSVFSKTAKGFISGDSTATTINNIKYGITGNTTGGAWSPSSASQTITYASCHDNNTLYDRLVNSVMPTGSNYRTRYENLVQMNKMSAAIEMTSQGTPFMLAGEEMARSKDGDGNSYASAATENMIDWNNLSTYGDLDSYYSGMMDIRKAFSAFRDPSSTSGKAINFATGTPTGTVAYTLNNLASATNEWSQVACLFNNSSTAQSVTLTGSGISNDWIVIANDKSAGVKSLGEVTGDTITVPASSAMVLVDKASFNSANIQSNKGTVTVKYVDQADPSNPLITKVLTGVIGTNYSTESDSSLSLHYDLASTPENANGVFSATDTTVTYVYTKYTGTFGTVVTNYVDESGATLSPSVTTTDRTGASYTTFPANVLFYSIDTAKSPDNAGGTYTDGQITVTYVYQYSGKQTTVHVRLADGVAWKPSLYAWDSSGATAVNLLGAWPGKAMTLEKGQWYDITFTTADSYNCIINSGSTQTLDLSGFSGDIWVVLNNKVLTKTASDTTVYTTAPQSYINEVTGTVAPTVVPTTPIATRKLGDVNNDGNVDLKDVTMLQKYLAKMTTNPVLTATDLHFGDVNADKANDLKDVTNIQKWLAKMTVPYSIGQPTT
ncbi:MAG: type I pullulanase [Bacillota bacterium]|nr:type I pullulanase [Bacillota bacterium]